MHGFRSNPGRHLPRSDTHEALNTCRRTLELGTALELAFRGLGLMTNPISLSFILLLTVTRGFTRQVMKGLCVNLEHKLNLFQILSKSI